MLLNELNNIVILKRLKMNNQQTVYPAKRPLPNIAEVIEDILNKTILKYDKLKLNNCKKIILIPYKPLSELDLNNEELLQKLKDQFAISEVEISEIDDDRFTYNLYLNEQSMYQRNKKSQFLSIKEDMNGLQDIFVKAMWEWLNIQDYVEFNDIVLEPEDLILEVTPGTNIIGTETQYAGVYFVL